MATIQITVNDIEHTIEIYEDDRLIDVLRDRLCLTGTKEG